MAELKQEQFFIVNTEKGEHCGTVKGIKSETEYEVVFINNVSGADLAEQQCKVYYRNKEGTRCFFSGNLLLQNETIILQQTGIAVFRGRKFTRFKIDIPITIRRENVLGGVVRESSPGSKSINVKTFDLSAGGMGIISETPFQVNSNLIVDLNLYDEKVKILGEVKYCIKKDVDFLVGVEFSVISDETRRKMEDLLLALES